jgi:hypothetical protein
MSPPVPAHHIEAADIVLGIGSAFAAALRAEIQMGSGMQQSYTPLHLYSPMFVLAAAAERRIVARLVRCGMPPPVAMSLACAISPPRCVSHTQPPHRQKAGSSWIANAIGALLRVGTSRSPSQRVCRYGSRQQRQPHRLGSLVLWQAPSRPHDMPPSRGVGRSARLCDSPAGMADANAIRPAASARFLRSSFGR